MSTRKILLALLASFLASQSAMSEEPLYPSDPPEIVIGPDGKKMARVLGELMPLSRVGFDVDGDKIAENLTDKMDNAAPGELFDVEVRFREGTTQETVDNIENVVGAIQDKHIYFINNNFYLLAKADAAQIRQLSLMPDVESILLTPIGRIDSVPDSLSQQPTGEAGIIVTPAHPTPNDRIIVTVFGVAGCTPKDPRVSLSGNEIHFDFPPPPDVDPNNSGMVGCVTALIPWAEAEQIGSLPAGTYDVIVTRWVSAAKPSSEIGRASFTVDPVSVKPKKLVCKNLTTEKQKMIKSRTSFKSCAAAGLKIRPGDRIQQISIGIAK
jgi:hypothetical protein